MSSSAIPRIDLVSPDERPLSIFLLIRSLEVGGAERQLVQLAMGLHERRYDVRVGVFYRRGELVDELVSRGIEIIDLRKTGRWDVFRFFVRAIKSLRQFRPDVIYSFLGGANIVAAVIRLFVPGTKLAWSVRASNMDLTQYDWLHRASFRLECAMSGMPDLIIANSRAGREFASAHGFPVAKIRVVPNGIDTERFRPNAGLRLQQRNAWGINDKHIVVGIVARLDPMKGHATFLRAASIASNQLPQLRFLCVGEGPEDQRLKRFTLELGIEESVLFTGFADPVAAFNALDLMCSCSITEGFSNAIAEAMACGITCIVTDVGDSALLVGATGDVVPPSDEESLARAIVTRAAGLHGESTQARKRIVDNFSASVMVDNTITFMRRLERDLSTTNGC